MKKARLLENPAEPALSPAELAALPPEQLKEYERLPEMLSPEEILAANRHTKLSGGRYEYRGMIFEIPEGVLTPGGTSEFLFDAIYDGALPVEGRTVTVMGCGAGVDVVVSALRGARDVFGFDIHEESVRAAKEAVSRHLDSERAARCHLAVSDLFAAMPEGSRADLVLFNPPANPIATSDPDLARVNFSGSSIMYRFFDEIAERRLLAPGGSVVVVLSNANNIRGIAAMGLRHGLRLEILRVRTWDAPFDSIVTHLLAFTSPLRAIPVDR